MPAQQQPILEAGTVVSRYRVEGLAARGGMGLVYRARDIRLDRPVALKVLSPELSDDERFRERFVRESRLAAAVDHPNVIPVYEADDWDGLLYIVMRFVVGVDLHTVLATSGRMSAAAALPLLGQAADALDAAHRLGLVHRDVKPGNFMLAGATADHLPTGTHVYLTDFGLTKRASSVSGLTRTGQFLGSLHYVAPEQIKGEEVGSRTDIYALACVAFEMFAGRPPFDMEGEAGLLWAHMSTAPPPLSSFRPDFPPAVDDVLARAMAKEPADRPATCAEFVDGLRGALAGLPGVVPSRRAAPTQVSGSQEASTAPHPSGGHPSFPPGTPLAGGPAPLDRQQTPVQPPVGWLASPAAGWAAAPAGGAPDALTSFGGPPPAGAPPAGAPGGGVPGGGVPGGPPPWDGASGAASPAPARRRRGRWWLIAALALVVVVAAGLVVWRPWAGPDLASQELVVVPFQADVPSDWDEFAVSGDSPYIVLGPRDWTGLWVEDGEAIAEAEAALPEDPASLVHMYVDPAYTVYAGDPQDLAGQVQSLIDGSTIVGQGTREVDGREAFTAGGVAPLGEGQFRVYVVTVQDEPRLYMAFVAPNALYDEWKPTFDAIVDSVRFTG